MASSRSSQRKFKGGGLAGKRGKQNGLVYAREIDVMPDYPNEAVRQTEDILGSFKYDPLDGT